jgi:hypothetical protein
LGVLVWRGGPPPPKTQRPKGDKVLDLSRSTPYSGLNKKIKIPISYQ